MSDGSVAVAVPSSRSIFGFSFVGLLMGSYLVLLMPRPSSARRPTDRPITLCEVQEIVNLKQNEGSLDLIIISVVARFPRPRGRHEYSYGHSYTVYSLFMSVCLFCLGVSSPIKII